MTRVACALAILALLSLIGMVVQTSGGTATLYVFIGIPALALAAICYGLAEGPHLRRLLIRWLGGGALTLAALVGFSWFASDSHADSATGAATYAERCASCHGSAGHGDGPVGRALRVPPLDASAVDAERVILAVREKAVHKAISGRIDDDSLRAISDHLRSFATTSE